MMIERPLTSAQPLGLDDFGLIDDGRDSAPPTSTAANRPILIGVLACLTASVAFVSIRAVIGAFYHADLRPEPTYRNSPELRIEPPPLPIKPHSIEGHGQRVAKNDQADYGGRLRDSPATRDNDAEYNGVPNKSTDPLPDGEDDLKLLVHEENASNHHARGISCYSDGAYEEAAAEFTAAIRIVPESADSFAWRAMTWFRLRQPPKALDDASAAVKLRPDRAEFYYVRARIKHAERLNEEALDDAVMAAKLDPHAANYVRFAEKLRREIVGNSGVDELLDERGRDGIPGRPENRWRYRLFEGRWWYWAPDGHWWFYDGHRWVAPKLRNP